MFLAEDDGSRSRAESEANTRDPDVCSLADVLSIQRACNSQGGDLDVAVEHSSVVCKATGVAGSKMRTTISHLLGIRREVDTTAYRSGELGEEVSGESSDALFGHDGSRKRG